MKLQQLIRTDLLTILKNMAANIRLMDRRKGYALWEQMHLENLFLRFRVDCVFDVGANAGQYASMLRRRTGFKGLIISFEPDPRMARALRAAAQSDALWIVEELALGSADGEQFFNIMNDSQFSSLSRPRADQAGIFSEANKVKEVISVRMETLPSAFHRLKNSYGFRRPFLKLDTQGNDVSIVRHAKQVMKEFVGLQSELAISKLYESSVDFREAITIYERCGFELSAFVPNNAGHFPRLVEMDCIMVRADLMEPAA